MTQKGKEDAKPKQGEAAVDEERDPKPGGKTKREVRGREEQGDGAAQGDDEGGGKQKGKGLPKDAAGRRDRLTGAMTFPSVYDKLDKRKEDSSIRGRSVASPQKEK